MMTPVQKLILQIRLKLEGPSTGVNKMFNHTKLSKVFVVKSKKMAF